AHDDIDLFIITAPGRLWTARFIALVFTYLCGVKRKRGVKKDSDKVCLNLFFDKKNLQIPKDKQTYFVAHELFQMKPIFDRNDSYQMVLRENKWAANLYPNASNYINNIQRKKDKVFTQSAWGDSAEKLLRFIQLFFINRHRTTERIDTYQLWFFPYDVEREVRDMW
ncbi:MAG: hypothetical protein ACMG6E_05300, partial [Candidatus Roizmanbacteria bacterium]